MGLNKEPGAPQVDLNDISDIRDRSIRMPPSRTEEEVKIEEKGEVFMDLQPNRDDGQQEAIVDEEMVQKSLEELSDIGEGQEEKKKEGDASSVEIGERDFEALAHSGSEDQRINRIPSGDGAHMKFTIPVDTSQSEKELDS